MNVIHSSGLVELFVTKHCFELMILLLKRTWDCRRNAVTRFYIFKTIKKVLEVERNTPFPTKISAFEIAESLGFFEELEINEESAEVEHVKS